MDGNIETTEELRLSDIFKLFWKNLKWLVLAFLIGVIAGGAFGLMKTWNKDYYGTSIQFYVNPKTADDDVDNKIYGAYGISSMSDMVAQLESHYFAEFLMLDDDGLPSKGISDEIDTLIDDAKALIADENANAEEKKAAIEAALNAWERMPDFNSLITTITNATKFIQASSADSENVSSSFITVQINVLNNEKFASELRVKLIEKVPKYVEKNMYVPDLKTETGDNLYIGTNCQRFSRADEITLQNPNQMLNTAVKYAALAGVVALLVVAIAILIVNDRDKRLKDYDRTFETLNVRVIGVVPSMQVDAKIPPDVIEEKTEKN